MRRSILLSLLVIGAAVTLIGAGSLALFNDSETSKDNTAQAGTLDLQVDGKDDPLGKVIEVADLKPSVQHLFGPIILKNVGSIDGTADIHIWRITDSGGTISEPECVAEGGTWDSATQTCSGNTPFDDISTKIDFDVCVDQNGNDSCDKPDEEVLVGKLAELESKTNDIGPLPAGGTMKIWLSIHLQEDADNEYQGDKSTFDVEFTLHQ